MYNLYEDIVPGNRIGDFIVNTLYDEMRFRSLIERDKTNPNMPESAVHEKNRNIALFLNENSIIQEIVAKNNYKGKVLGIFGIGDRLCDFKNKIEYETSIYDGQGFFYFPEMPGLRVLNTRWDEKGVYPIESIHVYDVALGSVL